MMSIGTFAFAAFRFLLQQVLPVSSFRRNNLTILLPISAVNMYSTGATMTTGTCSILVTAVTTLMRSLKTDHKLPTTGTT